jgi:hypothetical protein
MDLALGLQRVCLGQTMEIGVTVTRSRLGTSLNSRNHRKLRKPMYKLHFTFVAL